MAEILKVAMPKGRIYKKAAELFRAAGLPIDAEVDETRKLVIGLPELDMEFILAKPVDVRRTWNTERRISGSSARTC
ncbi:ATP phosphoribosyltransferase [Paenibacillus sp. P1XP2]|nr:ATP phosphoribosyltransferase [Paenibacillus sp. P1XP2]